MFGDTFAAFFLWFVQRLRRAELEAEREARVKLQQCSRSGVGFSGVRMLVVACCARLHSVRFITIERIKRTLECALETLQYARCAANAANKGLLGRRVLRRLNVYQDVLVRLSNNVKSCKPHLLVFQHRIAYHTPRSVTLSLETERLGQTGLRITHFYSFVRVG